MNRDLVAPNQLFGGTWERIKDVFLIGAGSSYTAGTTGGAASISYTPSGTVGNHTLTIAEIPSHSHTFTGTEVTSGNQSVAHHHSLTDYYATTTGTATISVAQIGSHQHSFYDYWGVYSDGSAFYCVPAGSTSGSTNGGTYGTGSGNTHTHSGANSNATGSLTSTDTTHTHKFTVKGTVGNEGSGDAHNHGFTGTVATINIMPPYTTIYMWKRVA